MFKRNHYYLVTHKENGATCPVRCVIQTIDCNNNGLWDVILLKVICIKDCLHDKYYQNGRRTQWFEDWCFDIREVKDINNESELLALEL